MSDTKVYVTKYALTEGILELTLISDHAEGRMCTVEMKDSIGGKGYFHGPDWWRSRVDAVRRANGMRAQKIAALEKKIAKLREMKFS